MHHADLICISFVGYGLITLENFGILISNENLSAVAVSRTE